MVMFSRKSDFHISITSTNLCTVLVGTESDFQALVCIKMLLFHHRGMCQVPENRIQNMVWKTGDE